MRVRPTRSIGVHGGSDCMAAWRSPRAALRKRPDRTNPGSVSKGDSVNLSGTYDLAAFTGCDGRRE